MKVLLAALAFVIMAVPAAHATENRITVNEVHTFISQANSALSNPNVIVGKNFLVNNVSENAVFENNILNYMPGHPNLGYVWHERAYSPYSYRYPYAHYPYYSNTSFKALGKWEKIGSFENKKRMVVGYTPEYVVTGIKMRPYASSAVVDVNLREYSTQYAPYYSHLTSGVLHANSKCKMYLSKHQGDLFLTRLDCNTTTNMPL